MADPSSTEPPAGGEPDPFDIGSAAFESVGENAAATAGIGAGEVDQAQLDELLKLVSGDGAPASDLVDPPPALAGSPAAAVPDTAALDLPSFQQVMADAQVSSIDLLRDVELNVKIELGRARMLVEDVLKLNEGAVVELDKLAGDPVDVFVNDRLVARGEVLVLNDNFCVRVNEIVTAFKEEQ